MEKNDYRKKLFIVLALAVSVLGVSIGFAAYSQTLSIKDSKAGVAPENTFTPNVKFSGTPSCSTIVGDAEVIRSGSLDDTEYTVWKDLEVRLSNPGDSVTCTVTVANTSVYDAYLKEISFNDKLTCGSDTSSNAEKICSENGVVASVYSGAPKDDSCSPTEENCAYVTGKAANNKTGISTNNVISSSSTGTITFKIAYIDNNNYVDDDVTVTIPVLNLVYKSANE